MAVQVIITKQCNCDLCDKSVPTESDLVKLLLPIKFLTDQTEGRACEPYYQNTRFDLCSECLEKVVVVMGEGAQGHNDYWIKGER